MPEANTVEKEAKAEAAFGAGFGVTPPAPAEKVVEVASPEPAKPATPVATPAVVPEKPQYVRLTKQEWDNTKAAAGKVSSLESQVAKLVGSMGSMPKADQLIQQVIENVRSQTPAGLSVEMSDEDFAELSADFPELAKSTRAALEKIFKKANVKGTGTSQPAAQPVNMDAVVERALELREYRALEKAYPTWREIVGQADVSKGEKPPEDNPFRQWLASQSTDYQEEVNETNSPAEVRAAIARFQADSAAPKTATPAQPDKAAARRAVIADAVTPRTDGNPPPVNAPISAEEAFATGFKTGRPH